MSLVTPKDVREALEWEPTKDAEAQRLAKIVTGQWEVLTTRLWFERTNYVHRVELDEFEKVIQLPLYPLTALTIVSWADGETEPADFSSPLTLDTDYTQNLDTGEVTILQTHGSNWFFIDWRHPDNWFKFQLTGGYTAASLLTDHVQGEEIKNILLLQAAYVYQRNISDHIIAQSVTLANEGGTASLRSNRYHPEFQDMAQRFRSQFTSG